MATPAFPSLALGFQFTDIVDPSLGAAFSKAMSSIPAQAVANNPALKAVVAAASVPAPTPVTSASSPGTSVTPMSTVITPSVGRPVGVFGFVQAHPFLTVASIAVLLGLARKRRRA